MVILIAVIFLISTATSVIANTTLPVFLGIPGISCDCGGILDKKKIVIITMIVTTIKLFCLFLYEDIAYSLELGYSQQNNDEVIFKVFD